MAFLAAWLIMTSVSHDLYKSENCVHTLKLRLCKRKRRWPPTDVYRSATCVKSADKNYIKTGVHLSWSEQLKQNPSSDDLGINGFLNS